MQVWRRNSGQAVTGFLAALAILLTAMVVCVFIARDAARGGFNKVTLEPGQKFVSATCEGSCVWILTTSADKPGIYKLEKRTRQGSLLRTIEITEQLAVNTER